MSESPSLPTILQLYEAASAYVQHASPTDPDYPSGSNPSTKLFASFIAGFNHGASSNITSFNRINGPFSSFNTGLAFYLFFTLRDTINPVLHELLRDHITFIYEPHEDLPLPILGRISPIHLKESSLPSAANTTLFYRIKKDFEDRFPFLRLNLFVHFGSDNKHMSYSINLA